MPHEYPWRSRAKIRVESQAKTGKRSFLFSPLAKKLLEQMAKETVLP
jgi:hypothetical protein